MTISTEKRLLIIKMYRNHERLKKICKALNVCRETVRKYRREAGCTGRYRR